MSPRDAEDTAPQPGEPPYAVRLALGVVEGRQTLEAARRSIAERDLAPEDLEAVPLVSGTVRSLLDVEPRKAYVLALLNREIARAPGCEAHRPAARLDLALALAATGAADEALPHLESLRRLVEEREIHRVSRAAVAGATAVARAHLGELEAARAGFLEAARASGEAGDRRSEAQWRLNAASIAEQASDLDEALDQLKEAERLTAETEGPLAAPIALALARVHFARGEEEAAMKSCRAAGELSVEIDAPGIAIEVLELMASHAVKHEESDKAVAALEHAVEIHAQTGAAPSPERLLGRLAGLHQVAGRVEECLRCYEKLRALYRSRGDTDLARRCLDEMAGLHMTSGDAVEAVRCYREALACLEDGADPSLELQQRHLLGRALAVCGEYEDAIDSLRAAVEIAGRIGDVRLLVESLVVLGEALGITGRPIEARAHLERASAHVHAGGDPVLRAAIDLQLGETHLCLGEPVPARERFEEAALTFHGLGMKQQEAAARCGQATAEIALGRCGDAIARLRPLVDDDDLDAPLVKATALGELGHASEVEGRSLDALDFHRRAAVIAVELGAHRLVAKFKEGMGNAQRELGERAAALDCYEESLRLVREARDLDREASVMGNRARAFLLAGDHDAAAADLERAVEIAKRMKNSWVVSSARLSLAEARRRQGRVDEALELIAAAIDGCERHRHTALLWRAIALKADVLEEDVGDDAGALAAYHRTIDEIDRLRGGDARADHSDWLAEIHLLLERAERVAERLGDAAEVERLRRRRLLEAGGEVALRAAGAGGSPEPRADVEPPAAPAWVGHARRFIGLGGDEHLDGATVSCDDERVRSFLTTLARRRGAIARDDWEGLARELDGEGRKAEALTVNLLGIHPMALAAAAPLTNSPEVDDVVLRACQDAAQASHAIGFPECEAFYLFSIGCRAEALGPDDLYLMSLSRAVVRYRELAAAEPGSYREKLATALDRLACAFGAAGDAHRARRAFREAIALRREMLADGDGAAALLRVLNNYGSFEQDQRSHDEARRALGEAQEIFEGLSAEDQLHLRGDLAVVLHNIGRAHVDARQLLRARDAHERALEIREELAREHPGRYDGDLAMTLNHLGAVLSSSGEHEAAIAPLERSLELVRASAGRHPAHRGLVVSTLNNLGGVYKAVGRPGAARGAYEEAIAVQRALAEESPRAGGHRLAELLQNLGAVLAEEGETGAASCALEESVALSRRLAASESGAPHPALTQALDNLGSVLLEAGRKEESARVTLEAIEAAESGETRGEAWLLKGRAAAAYRRRLGELVSSGDEPRAFACFAALREGLVRSLRARPEESLEGATAALRKVEAAVGRPIKVILAQRLGGGRDVFAVLDRDGLGLEGTEGAAHPVKDLFDEILGGFNPHLRRTPPSPESIAAAGAKAWAALPGLVREAFDDEGAEILISGDPVWIAFPWEALRIGDDDGAWLGLHRPLPRWSGVTAPALAGLSAQVFGDGSRDAAVVCAWDAVPWSPLPAARAEADSVAKALRRYGYDLVPDGRPLIGRSADPPSLSDAIGRRLALLHYTGHGDVDGDEEVLVLHGGPLAPPLSWGRRDLDRIRERVGGEAAMPQHPLVVLNSCHTGRAREFGGQRQDLSFRLLEAGAGGVVASGFPVLDHLGHIFGTALYDHAARHPMSRAIVDARRQVESIARDRQPHLWALWSLLVYHGNPFARCPHHRGGPG